jgi:aminoglycoside/choline kinase family phosphotransferase
LPEEPRRTIQKNLPVEFDAALYRWEQNYFFENCLGRFFGVEANALSALATLPSLGQIAEELARRPRVLVHRDFQSQNIIMRNGQAHLIDFQGMRPGLAEYDLASLLFDPYVTFSRAECEELLAEYESKRAAAGQPVASDSRSIFCLCGIQRLMQALGAYGFLGLIKGNKTFLDYIPAAMQSLRGLVGEIPDLEKLSVALERVS